MSTLKRLFDYTETAHSGPLENFTTEALAGAIKTDPVPIIDVLGRHGLVSPDLVTGVEPFTQVHVWNAERSGYVDLVLAVDTDDGATVEVWFENKVWASEGWGQLAFYSSVIAESDADGVKRHLAVLAPNPISDAENHVYIPWQHVAAAAKRRPQSLLWAELDEFLEEIGMTEDTTLPITAREAASLEDAHRLFVKMRSILTKANARARDEITDWSGDAWWKDGSVSTGIRRQFAEQGRFTLYDGTMYQAFLIWGAVPRPDGAWFVVHIETDPKRTGVRSELLRSVQGQLPDWGRPHGTWQVLAAERRAVTVESDSEAVEWFVARLHELQDAGVIRLIPTLGKGPVVDDVGGPDDVDDAEDEA